MASLADELAALNAKVDEAVAVSAGKTEAVESRIAGQLAEVTARIHDALVAGQDVPSSAGAPVEPPPAEAAPEPPAEPAGGGWHPAQY